MVHFLGNPLNAPTKLRNANLYHLSHDIKRFSVESLLCAPPFFLLTGKYIDFPFVLFEPFQYVFLYVSEFLLKPSFYAIFVWR